MQKISDTPRTDEMINGYEHLPILQRGQCWSLCRQLERELAELRQQVEKMKTCENCLEHYRDTDYKSQCLSHNTTARGVRSMKLCLDHGKKFWRLKI